MQRTENGYVIISCDFFGTDWDEVMPMIEGHQGSVISLAALEDAVDGAEPTEAAFKCTMCLREFDPGEKAWRCEEPPHPATANPNAVICWDCIRQADRAFSKDPDTEWDRKIAPDDRWR